MRHSDLKIFVVFGMYCDFLKKQKTKLCIVETYLIKSIIELTLKLNLFIYRKYTIWSELFQFADIIWRSLPLWLYVWSWKWVLSGFNVILNASFSYPACGFGGKVVWVYFAATNALNLSLRCRLPVVHKLPNFIKTNYDWIVKLLPSGHLSHRSFRQGVQCTQPGIPFGTEHRRTIRSVLRCRRSPPLRCWPASHSYFYQLKLLANEDENLKESTV